ncbi:peptidoglycan-binding protein [Pseudenhygromyxa sp. WMMC2535]|uniref:peptidoglycan-binding protein n=1 Tax=Pseudenhygromyxa sp. WMMC2535 TaxID=2712867 RepID=UPI001552180E|nr:peptidoglycan-binding protein [Pseudenhygromyxa sp. WMMC2535]NVB40335.1 peptidoglycan-binding protein [Pseudenhygromyxa sp. WMMC2535]
MNSRSMLDALGYGTDRRELERFQRDYNRLPPKRLLPLTGRFDEATAQAIELAYESRELFKLARDGV